MLINLTDAIIKHGLKIRGVVQVGAHFGEETDSYIANGITDIVLIEPCEETFKRLQEQTRGRAKLFNCACGEREETLVLYKETANKGQSNSILKPATHTSYYPDIVFHSTEVVDVYPLDALEFDRSRINFLVMDTQGSEGLVLKGATETLKGIDYIMTEINIEPLYENATLFDDLLKLIPDFEVIEKKMTNNGWGDCLLRRKKKMVSVPKEFQPREKKHYPSDNNPAFEEWFLDRYSESDNKSDRQYLPVMWTEYFKQNGYGNPRQIRPLQRYLDSLKGKKLFSVIQYDDGCLLDTSGLDIKFFGLGCKGDFQLPLLCQPHGKVEVKKNLLANFIGRETHPIREEVLKLKGLPGYYISTEQTNLEAYTYIMASSVFTLCPRGYGKTSFRIAEALEQGSIPVYISDDFLEPYGEPFTKYGLLVTEYDLPMLNDILNAIPEWKILELQSIGAEVYKQYFSYEGAYRYVINQLNQ